MKTVLIPDHVSNEVKIEKKILGDNYQIVCYHNEDKQFPNQIGKQLTEFYYGIISI